MHRHERTRLAAALAFAALTSAAHAEAPALTDAQAKKLFGAYYCNACHAVDEARIGPPFRSVALRYRGASPDRVRWLATKIMEGGAGSWGVVPMISNPAVSPDEALAIAGWILGLAPSAPER
jgi:cytochrome c